MEHSRREEIVRNKYPGVCYRCGEVVEPGAGHFEKLPGGGWRVQHADCAIKWRGIPDAVTLERNFLMRKRRENRDEDIAKGTGKAAQRARKRIRDREAEKDK